MVKIKRTRQLVLLIFVYYKCIIKIILLNNLIKMAKKIEYAILTLSTNESVEKTV